jgi:hypothetical protein
MKTKCICNECKARFQCYTNIKCFGNPVLQGLFESYLSDNMTVHDALKYMREDLRKALDSQTDLLGMAMNLEGIQKVHKDMDRKIMAKRALGI